MRAKPRREGVSTDIVVKGGMIQETWIAASRWDFGLGPAGNRAVFVTISSPFSGGFNDPDSLRRTIDAPREHDESWTGAGEKVHFQ